jgi:hypothetical protein
MATRDATNGSRRPSRRTGAGSVAADLRGHRTPAQLDRHGRHRPVTGDSLAPMSPLRRVVAAACLAIGVIVLAACGTISTSPPAPTPADFQGIASELTKADITIDRIVSGDAGCVDPVLIPTAIALDASGLDQAEPVRIYLYIFRNRGSFERLRASVDDCARSFVTDPATYESIEQSPFVLAGQGPWAPEFEGAIRSALEVAAGTGN